MFSQNQVLAGTYQILQPIGNGGSSSVYLAYHLRLQKYVVVKQLKIRMSDDQKLRTEVDILKNLHHPGLPQVYDFFQEQGAVYTVIDYVDGADLESYIRQGYRFPEAQLLRWMRQVADVLSYLHSQSPAVIHSDIKPGNIIIDGNGNAILIDFNTSIGENRGNLLGLTLPYASPEQLQMARDLAYLQYTGMQLDPRSDLYSLGAAFYELICGIRPVPDQPPRPLRTMGLSEYSGDFLRLVDRLMEYDREKRVKSAKRLLSALDRLSTGYKSYFVARCACVLLSAALVGSGVYCCIRGAVQRPGELYASGYHAVTQAISQGHLELAAEQYDAMLQDGTLQGYLKRTPHAQAEMYHARGDIAYYSENYAEAAAYYGYALAICDPQLLPVYYRDAALAYAQAGDPATARSYLEAARKAGAPTEELQLIEIVLYARDGNAAKCMAEAERLLATCHVPDICIRAAQCAASVAPTPEEKILWLQRAEGYGTNRAIRRGLAAAYGEQAKASTGNQRDNALRSAIRIYEELNRSEYASSNDRLNYATVLRMDGQRDKAIQVLENAAVYDPNNYRILMDLCFIYHEAGNTTKATDYCGRALRAWRSDTSPGKLSENSEQIQNLLELARRYGIGGGQ